MRCYSFKWWLVDRWNSFGYLSFLNNVWGLTWVVFIGELYILYFEIKVRRHKLKLNYSREPMSSVSLRDYQYWYHFHDQKFYLSDHLDEEYRKLWSSKYFFAEILTYLQVDLIIIKTRNVYVIIDSKVPHIQ